MNMSSAMTLEFVPTSSLVQGMLVTGSRYEQQMRCTYVTLRRPSSIGFIRF